MAYDHIFFYESVIHAYIYVTTPWIPYVTPCGGEKSTHTTLHAFHQVLTLLGRTAAHAESTARHNFSTVKRGSSMSWIKTPFGSKHAQLGSCLDSELTSPWPPHPVVPEKLLYHMLSVPWHCSGHTPSFVQKRSSPRETYYPREVLCGVCGWGFHLAPPVHTPNSSE